VQLLRIITVLAKKAAELEKNQVPHLFLNTRIVNVDWCLDYFAECWLASLLLCDKDKKKIYYIPHHLWFYGLGHYVVIGKFFLIKRQ
jgi:hypothetical protein